jgi:hypothetical protein
VDGWSCCNQRSLWLLSLAFWEVLEQTSDIVFVFTGRLDLVCYIFVRVPGAVVIWVEDAGLVTFDCLKFAQLFILMIDVWKVDWVVWRHVGFDFFVRQKLSLHSVSVHIWKMVDNVLAKIRSNLLLLFLAVMSCSFIHAIIASQGLSFSFCVLLKK